jgi:hypothetical protein
MKKNQGILIVTKLFALAVSVFFLSSCSTEDEMVAPAAATTMDEIDTTTPANEPEVASFTLSGIYTEITENTDCATCTYVVPANATTIDGKELGFAPGSVICLDKALRYKSLEFVNLEGTIESPITISYCSK